MRHSKLNILLVLASAGALLAASAPLAADEPGPAGIAVDGALQRARSIVLDEGERSQKLLSLQDVATELLDTRAMGHRALGPELAEHPDAQQQEFLELFDLMMVRTYLQKLLLFRDPEFRVVAEDSLPNAVVVHTKIFTPKDEYLVDYEMRLHDDQWRATDVVVEGISITRNYRSQLRGLLRSHSFEELLERMRRKTRTLAEPKGL